MENICVVVKDKYKIASSMKITCQK